MWTIKIKQTKKKKARMMWILLCYFRINLLRKCSLNQLKPNYAQKLVMYFKSGADPKFSTCTILIRIDAVNAILDKTNFEKMANFLREKTKSMHIIVISENKQFYHTPMRFSSPHNFSCSAYWELKNGKSVNWKTI